MRALKFYAYMAPFAALMIVWGGVIPFVAPKGK